MNLCECFTFPVLQLVQLCMVCVFYPEVHCMSLHTDDMYYKIVRHKVVFCHYWGVSTLSCRGSGVSATDFVSVSSSLHLTHPFQKFSPLASEIAHEKCGLHPAKW